jgi:hypothetical protein
MYDLKDCKIISVDVVEGRTLKSNWKSQMQVVETDQGRFIDNMPGRKFSRLSYAEDGFDWSRHIGEVVKDCKIIRDSGYLWINKG